MFTSTSGPIADQQAAVEQQIQAISKVQHVSSVDDPFASDAVGTISPDKLNAMSSIQFDVPATSLPPEAITQVEAAAQPPAGAAFTVTLGGAMYPPTGVGIGITEVLGVLLAFAVLAITFASLLAAGLPLVTAALHASLRLPPTRDGADQRRAPARPRRRRRAGPRRRGRDGGAGMTDRNRP